MFAKVGRFHTLMLHLLLGVVCHALALPEHMCSVTLITFATQAAHNKIYRTSGLENKVNSQE